jgi:hypothetical protein
MVLPASGETGFQHQRQRKGTERCALLLVVREITRSSLLARQHAQHLGSQLKAKVDRGVSSGAIRFSQD